MSSILNLTQFAYCLWELLTHAACGVTQTKRVGGSRCEFKEVFWLCMFGVQQLDLHESLPSIVAIYEAPVAAASVAVMTLPLVLKMALRVVAPRVSKKKSPE